MSPFVTTATVTTHAMPFHCGCSDASRYISSLASAMDSRTRSATGPVSRSRRVRILASAVSAAFSPAAWPPTPSTTMKTPRTGSCWWRSPLISRCTPESVAPPANNPLWTCIGGKLRGFELKKHRIGEADASAVGQRRLDAVLAFRPALIVKTTSHALAVDGGAEHAEIDEEEFSRCVAPDARMFARDVHRGLDLEIGAVGDAA